MLLDPESGELTIKAAHGLKVEHIVQSRLAPGEGLAGLAAKEGVVMYSREVLKDGRFRLREIAREEGLRSALSVPLLAQERVIGVLNLYTDAPRQFTDSEHRLISTLANSAAIAIENARLYEETRERAQFLFALMGEINRRVRSNLQSVAALLQLELADPATSKEQALRNCIGRLHSIAAVHELLQAENVELVDVKEIARRILDLGRQNFLPRGAEIRLGVSGTHLLLPSQQATSLAIAVHELVDNAFAHGFPDREKGRISICLSVVKERAILQVQDDGVGLPSGFSLAKTGLGLRIVRGLVEDELGGEFSLSSGERGTIARMQIPT
jgi:two-component sensor histidine kinase